MGRRASGVMSLQEVCSHPVTPALSPDVPALLIALAYFYMNISDFYSPRTTVLDKEAGSGAAPVCKSDAERGCGNGRETCSRLYSISSRSWVTMDRILGAFPRNVE